MFLGPLEVFLYMLFKLHSNPIVSTIITCILRIKKLRPSTTDFTFTFHFHALEKEMATHSSVLAWRIPGMAEPGGLPFVGSHRVGHD